MSAERLTRVYSANHIHDCQSSIVAVLDIVFVHGLGGDRQDTWTNAAGGFWPEWLATDFPQCRVFVAGYESSTFASPKAGGGASIQDLAGSLADELASIEPLSSNLLIITHSLGGLVTKQMLRRCKESYNSDFIQVGRAVTGVIFLGTPHLGAQLSNALDIILKNCKSRQVQQLSYAEDGLLDLNNFFRNHAAQSNLKVAVYHETEKTWGAMVVDKITANPNVLGSEPVAIQANHIDICKPSSREAKLYPSVCRMVRGMVGPTGGSVPSGGSDVVSKDADDTTSVVAADTMNEYGYFTTGAQDDRRTLKQKLEAVGRSYQVRRAEKAKERFAMTLQRNIAQPSAVARYARLMADVESRFNRHVARVIAQGADDEAIDAVIQSDVVDPCSAAHSLGDYPIPASLVDGALYYLAGNCHLAFDNE